MMCFICWFFLLVLAESIFLFLYFVYIANKTKNKQCHTDGTVPKSNAKIVKTEPRSIPLSHIYMTSQLLKETGDNITFKIIDDACQTNL
jgi:hypothetical protein